MRRMRAPALLAPVAAGILVFASLAGCLTGCGGGVLSPDLVLVNGGEPPYPLVPTSTNDSNGGRIIDRLFAGLMSYDAAGNPSKEVARSIETTDNINYRIVLKPDWKFTDGSPVTAHSFVDAWNYGALSTNAQLQQSFFSPIDGFDEVSGGTSDGKPGRTAMSGLQVVNDLEFTVRLKAPTIDFLLRLGHSAFYPLPDIAFRDMAAFGRDPVGNGPYKLADSPDGPSWEHNVKIDLRPNPDYHGNRKPHNKGLRFEFYANLDTAYADLLSGNLDVLDTIPPSALPIYKRDLGDNFTSGPVAVKHSLDTPLRLPHFGGEEGRLRRLALSAAVNREQICKQIFVGTRSPSRDFTARSLPGFDPNLPGNDVLNFDPDRARRLWKQADAISAWSGQYVIAYNADAGNQEWGGRRGQQRQERSGYRRGWRSAANLRRISHRDHQPHDLDGLPRRLAGRLPVDDRVSCPAVCHRGRFQRCRLLQPRVRRGAGGRRGRPQSAGVECPGQCRTAIPHARHARCSALGQHQRGGVVHGGQERTCHLERSA